MGFVQKVEAFGTLGCRDCEMDFTGPASNSVEDCERNSHVPKSLQHRQKRVMKSAPVARLGLKDNFVGILG